VKAAPGSGRLVLHPKGLSALPVVQIAPVKKRTPPWVWALAAALFVVAVVVAVVFLAEKP
jgi:hypothetical protein